MWMAPPPRTVGPGHAISGVRVLFDAVPKRAVEMKHPMYASADGKADR